MNSQQLPLVTYEQAEKLKAAGFDWREGCTSFWYDFFGTATLKRIDAFRNYNHEMCWLAPTVALALKWLRDVKGIVGWVVFSYDGLFYYIVRRRDVDSYVKLSVGFSRCSPCESALLDEILALLEEDARTPEPTKNEQR